MAELNTNDLWVIDVEQFANFHSLCAIHATTDQRKDFVLHSSRDDRISYINWLNSCKGWVTFNGLHYDYPLVHNIIENKSFFLNSDIGTVLKWLFKKSNKLFKQDYNVISDEDSHILQYDLFKINHYDRFRCSLKWVEFSLRWKNVKDLPIKPGSYVTEDQINDIIRYNYNDVEATKMFWENCQKKVELRRTISDMYGITARNLSDSSIGKKILLKYYIQKTGLSYYDIKNLKDTQYLTRFRDVISDKIQFDTPELQKFLDKLKNDNTNLLSGKKEVKLHYKNATFTIAKGGIHTKMPPMHIEEDNDHYLVDFDWGSYYPNLMIFLKIFPPHLGKEILEQLSKMTTQRLKAKAEGDKMTSDSLKLSINSCFGQTGDKHSFMYSPTSMLKVTINGQLFMLMLIEKLYQSLGDDVWCFYTNTKKCWCSKTFLMRETGKAFTYQLEQAIDSRAKSNFGDMVKTVKDIFTIRSEASQKRCVLNDHRKAVLN